ncbi:glycosyl hydrolase family 53 protein [Lipomyces japonicus]|uniref:glycosyl hydrolase family 53 protein n=1 Tax=Lipomyces japonicus TaxID=56871 RepID=UPI0034CDDFCB
MRGGAIVGALISLLSLTQAKLLYKGVDASSLLISESSGTSFKDVHGNLKPVEQILSESGINTSRQRIWVNPDGGSYNLDYNLVLAQRMRKAGLDIYLDFHYSDYWADPSKQATPGGWSTDNITVLEGQLYNYTKNVCDTFYEYGISLKFISIGNEIRHGLLWPLATSSSFDNVASLLHVASKAIRDSKQGSKPQIMIHIDNGWNWEQQSFFYDSILAQGSLTSKDFDVIGVSYYPFYGSDATLSDLNTTLRNLHATYKKPVLVVETDWPYNCPDPAYQLPSDLSDIPFSESGQIQFLKRLASVIDSAVPKSGLFYWEPTWVQNAALGSSCWDNLLVSYEGQARKSLSTFASF